VASFRYKRILGQQVGRTDLKLINKFHVDFLGARVRVRVNPNINKFHVDFLGARVRVYPNINKFHVDFLGKK
jgi:hypothetical protein